MSSWPILNKRWWIGHANNTLSTLPINIKGLITGLVVINIHLIRYSNTRCSCWTHSYKVFLIWFEEWRFGFYIILRLRNQLWLLRSHATRPVGSRHHTLPSRLSSCFSLILLLIYCLFVIYLALNWSLIVCPLFQVLIEVILTILLMMCLLERRVNMGILLVHRYQIWVLAWMDWYDYWWRWNQGCVCLFSWNWRSGVDMVDYWTVEIYIIIHVVNVCVPFLVVLLELIVCSWLLLSVLEVLSLQFHNVSEGLR